MDLMDYDSMKKVQLRNMTVVELIEKLEKREKIVRKHFDKVVDDSDGYPGDEVEEVSYSIAAGIIHEGKELEGFESVEPSEYRSDVDSLVSEVKSGLRDMMDDIHMIRKQLRQRLFAVGKTMYGEPFGGDRVEGILKKHERKVNKLEKDVGKLYEHGHDGEVETGRVTVKASETNKRE